ncbi:PEP-CTERM sorting domain-containing protein [Chitinimonas arctica]|uniref:PEP-CTERM sorting domain-containing protein n=2 Tax=Chitinimonas arctica TaxID=2594795 RepID=A0A516SMD4_9NEIS|nr:PEP-CTERM sorting domain-containing protein [Chitinimonas arctica]
MDIYASSKASGQMEVAIDRLRAGGRVDSVASWHDTINNQSGNSQNYRMNLDLSSLNASMGGFISNTSQRDFRAGFVANVLVNGISVWQTAQTFKLTGNQASVVKNGVDIGDATVTQGGSDNADFSFALSNYQGSANLGSFASGQSADVTYQLSTFAYWDDPAGCSYECGQVSIRAVDPLGAGGSRIVSAPVPEPESYALLLGGLGVVAGVVARRRRALLK